MQSWSKMVPSVFFGRLFNRFWGPSWTLSKSTLLNFATVFWRFFVLVVSGFKLCLISVFYAFRDIRLSEKIYAVNTGLEAFRESLKACADWVSTVTKLPQFYKKLN